MKTFAKASTAFTTWTRAAGTKIFAAVKTFGETAAIKTEAAAAMRIFEGESAAIKKNCATPAAIKTWATPAI